MKLHKQLLNTIIIFLWSTYISPWQSFTSVIVIYVYMYLLTQFKLICAPYDPQGIDSCFSYMHVISQLCTSVLSDTNTKSIVDMEPLWCELELEVVTEDQEILVVPQVLLLVGAALEPQELEANGSSGNGATCTGGTGGSSSIFFLYMWCS